MRGFVKWLVAGAAALGIAFGATTASADAFEEEPMETVRHFKCGVHPHHRSLNWEGHDPTAVTCHKCVYTTTVRKHKPRYRKKHHHHPHDHHGHGRHYGHHQHAGHDVHVRPARPYVGHPPQYGHHSSWSQYDYAGQCSAYGCRRAYDHVAHTHPYPLRSNRRVRYSAHY